MSSPNPGPPGQYNSSNSGNVYATQKGNINIGVPAPAGLRIDSKVLLVVLLSDGIFFLFGMLAYTGKNTSGDQWRAGIFVLLLLMTLGMVGRWVRRRV